MTALTRYSLTLPPDVDAVSLVGPGNEIVHFIEDSFDALITVRGDTITFAGDHEQTQALTALFGDMIKVVQQGQTVDLDSVRNAVGLIKNGTYGSSSLREDVILTYRGRAIRPKTVGQKRYVNAMRSSTITFGVGPAGTGKTYLAMAMAVAALKRKEVGRIVLTRPVVEAGENLGFWPGSLMEKIDPYIRPLYDALFDMMDMEKANALLENGVIEIAPLAFMRGRTLNDSFIILDEAQNTTPEQMKMFLTRLGFGSKMVITGDITQLDLPKGVSGLKSVQDILEDVDDISFCELTNFDVVRHSLVAAIVAAYEEHDAVSGGNSGKRGSAVKPFHNDTPKQTRSLKDLSEETRNEEQAASSVDASAASADAETPKAGETAKAGENAPDAKNAPGAKNAADQKPSRFQPDLGVAWATVGEMHPTLVAVGKGERPDKDAQPRPLRKKRGELFKPDTGVVEAILGAEMFKTLEKVYSKPRWTPEDMTEEEAAQSQAQTLHKKEGSQQ